MNEEIIGIILHEHGKPIPQKCKDRKCGRRIGIVSKKTGSDYVNFIGGLIGKDKESSFKERVTFVFGEDASLCPDCDQYQVSSYFRCTSDPDPKYEINYWPNNR